MSDVEVVTQIYEAFVTQDVERLFSLVDPESSSPRIHHCRGAGVTSVMTASLSSPRALAGTIDSKVTTESLFEAAARSSSAAGPGLVHATGVSFDVPEVHTWTVKDGKAIAAHFAIDTPAMLEALGRAQ